jgi:hypothetical protein
MMTAAERMKITEFIGTELATAATTATLVRASSVMRMPDEHDACENRLN